MEHHFYNIFVATQFQIDFVEKIGDRAVPVEIKAATRIHRKYLTSIFQYLRITGENFGVICSAAPFTVFQEENLNIINIPLYYCSRNWLEKIVEKYAQK